MTICPNCGEEVLPRFRYCGVCGAALEPDAEREVRKVVTVLFLDVEGSTPLGEQLDPERWRHVLQSYFRTVERVIVSHGGLVEKFAGDAVLAVFGLPAAHEDDALRAVRAAAEVRGRLPRLAEETGFALAFRTGINTGEVVAGAGQTLVTGDAVNVAARLEQAAQPGEILLGAETVRLLGHAVEAEPLPPLRLQGKAEPVGAFRFRCLTAPEEGARFLFVDRERELALLADAFCRASEEREFHLFTLLGPAGIGKSRLAEEFLASLAEAQVVRGRCLSYGQAITYWPLVEVLRALGEPAELALERIVSGGGTSPQELAWTVQRALEQTAEEGPLLVALEDLHWAEPALLDLLDCVCELSRGYPILLLCLARPELLEARPSWGGGKPNAASVLLEPLPRGDCELLLERLRGGLEPRQRRRVLELAAGNPLFLEELAHFLAEGGDEGELPPRIHALLQARLDLLPEPERLLLACASVEGVVFHCEGLKRLVPRELRTDLRGRLLALTRTELIRPARGELADEEAFGFRHQLIRDTAYGALPREERARLHERFGDWLEKHGREHGEVEDICAYHLEQAALCKRTLGAAEPQLAARAAVALAAAAERARSRPDVRAAVGLWRRALALLEEGDPRVPELKLRLALVLMELGLYEEGRQLLEEAGERTTDPLVTTNVRLARLQVGLFGASEAPDAVRRECADAIQLFEERGDHRSLVRAWWTLALAETIDLHLETSAQAYAHAAAQGRLAGDRTRETNARGQRMLTLGFQRVPYSTAIRELERLAEEFPGEPMIGFDLGYFRALAAYEAGRVAEARELACDVLDALRRAGDTSMAAFGVAFVGRCEALAGDLDEAERLALSSVSETREVGAGVFLAWALLLLAEIRVLQGRYSEGLRLADEADTQGGPYDRTTLIRANSIRARAHTRLGAIEEARAAAATAVAAAETSDALFEHAYAQEALAEALAAADELPAALAAAEEARRLYTTLERTLLAQRAAALAEQIERSVAQAKEPATTA